MYKSTARLLAVALLGATLVVSGCGTQSKSSPQGYVTENPPSGAGAATAAFPKAQWPAAPTASPADIQAAKTKALQFVNDRKFDDAAKVLEPLAGAKDAQLQINLGIVEYNKEKLDDAAAAYLRALDVEPNNPIATNNLGNVYRDQKKYDLAEQAYRKAIELSATTPYPYLNLALMFDQREQKPDAAVEIMQSAIKAIPTNAGLHVTLGHIYLRQKKYDLANAEFNTTLKMDPKNSEAKQGLETVAKEAAKK